MTQPGQKGFIAAISLG